MIFHSLQDLQADSAPSGQVLEGLSFSDVFWPQSTVHIPSSIKLKDYHLQSFRVSLEQNIWDNKGLCAQLTSSQPAEHSIIHLSVGTHWKDRQQTTIYYVDSANSPYK